MSDETLSAVDIEVRRLVEECYRYALRVLGEHRPQLDRIVDALLANETLDEAAAYAAAGIDHATTGPAVPVATVGVVS